MKRALPAVVFFGLTLGAFGSAFGVNTAIRYLVAPDAGALRAVTGDVGELDGSAGRPLARAARVRGESEYLHEILRRNLFDAAFIDTYNPQASSEGGEEVVRTDLKIQLLGTVVAEPAHYSSALIGEEGSNRPHGYGVGDKIYDAEIIRIEPKVVTLKRGDGRIEQLTLESEATPPRTAGTGGGGSDSSEGIEQISETSYVVDRSLIDKYLQDIDSISNLGRALLHRGPDGQFDGYRLSAIRRGTLGDKLGIKNGDVIHAVNGMPLNSVQGAMAAYQTLMNERSFSFEVTRRGQKMTMEYQVR